MTAYEVIENAALSLLLVMATVLMLRQKAPFIFKKRPKKHKKTFIEQEYAREGRKCPSEAPGGPVTAEPICSNDICKGFSEAGANSEKASRQLIDLMCHGLTFEEFNDILEDEKEL